MPPFQALSTGQGEALSLPVARGLKKESKFRSIKDYFSKK
ncbi:hypothetical protein HMPREF9080_00284 [Cardiobacterium valvarum F0432]|uniref:Uncharacterized protein n=1 Tax=Cardiobacterium valvarum F0432 TaxID=797473 RepID=G9ZC08_9GAMM|nr:hypothetical protein HMPREF9080_00284 [Cardiobacterium valvarum F0432]